MSTDDRRDDVVEIVDAELGVRLTLSREGHDAGRSPRPMAASSPVVEELRRRTSELETAIAALRRVTRGGSGQSSAREQLLDRGLVAAERQLVALCREQAELVLEQAPLDDLTGALRRGAGLLQLRVEAQRTARNKQPLTLAYIDINALKRVNDQHGHAAGDLLLQAFSHTVRTHTRAYDVFVRMGGDEFLLGLPGLEPVEADRRLLAVAATLAADLPGAAFSFGTAELASGESLEAVIGRADAAMYAARRRQLGTAPMADIIELPRPAPPEPAS